jgi:hypothetical protein
MQERNKRLKFAIAAWSMIATAVGLTGCATGGGGGAQQTLMEKCTAAAKTESERSQCAWANAERMAGGR